MLKNPKGSVFQVAKVYLHFSSWLRPAACVNSGPSFLLPSAFVPLTLLPLHLLVLCLWAGGAVVTVSVTTDSTRGWPLAEDLSKVPCLGQTAQQVRPKMGSALPSSVWSKEKVYRTRMDAFVLAWGTLGSCSFFPPGDSMGPLLRNECKRKSCRQTRAYIPCSQDDVC